MLPGGRSAKIGCSTAATGQSATTQDLTSLFFRSCQNSSAIRGVTHQKSFSPGTPRPHTSGLPDRTIAVRRGRVFKAHQKPTSRFGSETDNNWTGPLCLRFWECSGLTELWYRREATFFAECDIDFLVTELQLGNAVFRSSSFANRRPPRSVPG